ncbi:MAG TPA: FAD-dependent oxidoreductase, partial [Vampirovibrionales bacterium]
LHVFFGAYEEIFDLMKELDTYKYIDWKEHVLTYTLDKGERFDFRTINLPSPLHLLPAVFQNRYFSIWEKLSLWKALFPILFGGRKYYKSQDKYSYKEWHESFGISEKMLKKMFLPMTLALKFLTPPDVSANIVLDVTGTFLSQNSASKIGMLKGSPEIYISKPLEEDILTRGGQVTKNLKLKEVQLKDNCDEIKGLIFEDEKGDSIIKEANDYIFALPIHNLKKVMPQTWVKKYKYFNGLNELASVPVVTLHLWLDKQVSGINNILFCPDGHIPVYADMANTTPDYYNDGASRFQFVVAPAFEFIKKTDQEIKEEIWQNLKNVFPESTEGVNITKSKVVRVPNSVYWPKPGHEKYRVPQKTPIANLFLAGGYTQQEFYDSMEGAVRSGNRAAIALEEKYISAN